MIIQNEINGYVYYRIVPRKVEKNEAFVGMIKYIIESPWILSSCKSEWLNKSVCPYCCDFNFSNYESLDSGKVLCDGCKHEFIFYDYTYEQELVDKFEKIQKNDKNATILSGAIAVEYADGSTAWYFEGKLHRIDGPAVECSDGYKEYYLNGKLQNFPIKRNIYDSFDISCENKGVKWIKII